MIQLGIVTYNIAKDWDLPTILKRLEALGYQGVELRTGHAHQALFNGHLNDGHFSAPGSALWGRVVGRRIALLLDARSLAVGTGPPAPAPEPSGEE